MKTAEFVRLQLEGNDKISNILKNDQRGLLDYEWFENVLEERFANDSGRGGEFLCRVIDMAKESHPYSQKDGKSYNPLKNIVRGLSIRFNAVYSESLGSKFRLATHKSKNTSLVPVAGKKATVSKEERAIEIVQSLVGTDTSVIDLVRDNAHALALQLNDELKELDKARSSKEKKDLAELQDKVISLANKAGLLSKTGNTIADGKIMSGIMAGLQAHG